MIMTIEMLNENDFIKTGDLSLAGFLFLHYPLEVIERPYGNKKALFVFQKNEHTDELIASFWRGDELVEPRRYFEALRLIKGRLYAE